MTGPPLVALERVVRTFRRPDGMTVRAVDGVDLAVGANESVGLIGESGSGKSTVGRLAVRLIEPDSGTVRFDGVDLATLSAPDLRRRRNEFQIVFQDVAGSMNPRMTVAGIVGEPLEVHGLVSCRGERVERVADLLRTVGLDPGMARRYPHELSGGERQRVGIARAIATTPRFLVADEPVSAVDAAIRGRLVDLLGELRETRGMSYLVIAHDLDLIRRLADRVVVLYLGKVAESGPAEEVRRAPLHPYTQALVAAVPGLDPTTPAPAVLPGEPPSSLFPPPGCRFHPRCPVAVAACATVEPALRPAGGGRSVACHLVHAPGGVALDGSAGGEGLG